MLRCWNVRHYLGFETNVVALTSHNALKKAFREYKKTRKNVDFIIFKNMCSIEVISN